MPGDLLAGARWACTDTPPGQAPGPAALDSPGRVWWPASVPGTAAAALRAAGEASWEQIDYDAHDWWFTTTFIAAEPAAAHLHVDGVATLSEIYLDGRLVLESENMFCPRRVRVVVGAGEHELAICCRALAPRLAERRPRPRWRTALIAQQNLRYFRTSLLGRMPGWSNFAAPVGPWRPVRLASVEEAPIVRYRLSTEHSSERGTVTLDATLARGGSVATLVVGDHEASAEVRPVRDAARLHGHLDVPDPQLWWPHTHGEQPLYPVHLLLDGERFDLGAVGFRSVALDRSNGDFRLFVNGEPLFCRGACWVPLDVVTLTSSASELRNALARAQEMGANLLRIPGTMVYESTAFYSLCDELGLLVWQDCMLANVDPPDEPAYLSSLLDELDALFDTVSGHPSLAVISGGSEIEQQAAMAGAAREDWVPRIVGELIPGIVREQLGGLPYVTSSPSGGDLPFENDTGAAHYFGVGAYLRPLEDARRADVRFAAECLAFATPPERPLVERVFGGASAAGHTPRWKAAVPRDASAAWDFEDVTNAYVARLFDLDPMTVRYADPERALDLARAAVAHCVERVISEWRSANSRCAGALVLSLRDLAPGAGWGLVDAEGWPKASWYGFRRAAAPVALLATDEGLNGLRLHVVNETAATLSASVRVELFAHGETLVDVAERTVDVPARSVHPFNVAGLFTHFVDLVDAYRFGPPSHDVITATMRSETGALLADVVELPLGLGRAVEADVGLEAAAAPTPAGYELVLRSRRLAEFVSIECSGYLPADSWFHLAPGHERRVQLRPDGAQPPPRPLVHALNCAFSTRAVVTAPAEAVAAR